MANGRLSGLGSRHDSNNVGGLVHERKERPRDPEPKGKDHRGHYKHRAELPGTLGASARNGPGTQNPKARITAATTSIAPSFQGHSAAGGAFSGGTPRFIRDMCRRKPTNTVTT